MYSALTKEEVMQWRRTTEKITLEEFAQRLGKAVQTKKETNDLHDLLKRKKDEPEVVEVKKEAQVIKKVETVKKIEKVEKVAKIANEANIAAINKVEKADKVDKKPEKQQKPSFEIKISFKKKLNKREEVVFNYFCENRKRKVSVADLANLLQLPNDYVYKYIKNLRNKLETDVLVNADKGGYILNI